MFEVALRNKNDDTINVTKTNGGITSPAMSEILQRLYWELEDGWSINIKQVEDLTLVPHRRRVG